MPATERAQSGPADIALQARALCDDPASFFDHNYTAMMSIDRDALEDLQLEGIRWRLSALRGKVAMLGKLADSQGIDQIDDFNAVVPLLFEHTMYKSYPPSLLENGRFKDINLFLSKLTSVDLSGVDVSACQSIDDWMETMDRDSPLLLMHSSGTSGTMSFLPVSKKEWDKFGAALRVTFLQNFGQDPAEVETGEEIHAIYPYFRQGGAGHVRMCEIYVKHICGSEERLHTAYPGRMSSDLLYMGAKIRAAQAKGQLDRLKISPALLARKAELEAIQAAMPEHLMIFFAELAETLKGKRVFFWGAQNLLYNVTKIGHEKGLTDVFAPTSVIGTGGDSKDGIVMPGDWREQVCSFVGVDRVKMCYGMSEVLGLHNKCAAGHYHFVPWVVPFVLDPDTSAVLPRSGITTGRAAFFDLGAETRWGGFITGDEYTIHWDEPCACGAKAVWAEDNIQRLSAKRGGDDKISCAATEGAHKDAMNFLNSFG
jgi:hypothetical protein